MWCSHHVPHSPAVGFSGCKCIWSLTIVYLMGFSPIFWLFPLPTAIGGGNSLLVSLISLQQLLFHSEAVTIVQRLRSCPATWHTGLCSHWYPWVVGCIAKDFLPKFLPLTRKAHFTHGHIQAFINEELTRLKVYALISMCIMCYSKTFSYLL